ncbi:MxaL protein [Ideonella sp. A 288]|uniref:MxaL protein n=1 Tax=Ideonella sp. A 288 TaxID=1962181 RepID=UPI00287322D3|nr:MxaL protein [Ideonella sp. A 288]
MTVLAGLGGSARRLARRLWSRRGVRDTLPIAVALLLLAVAVAMPPLTLQRSTYRYLVTFDVTQSMDVEDLRLDGAAVSRLAFARAATREALRRLPCGSHVGWAVFADYRVMPLMEPVEVCSHYEALLASLARIDGRMRWANASNIGKGATWVVRTARQFDAHTRVVFFTDGHESPPLRSAQVRPPMQDITAGQVGGWLVGVGGDLAQPIPRTDRDGVRIGHWDAADVVQRFGAGAPGTAHEHLSELREPHLRELAELLGLGYRRLQSTEALVEAMLSPELALPAPVATDLRWVPALLALLVLAWRFTPDLRWPRRRPA